MDCSEERLDRIESQRSTNVSHAQRSLRRYFPMNLMKTGLRTLSSRGLLQTGGEVTEPVQKFSTHLFDVPGEYVSMSPDVFSAVSEGNKEWLEILVSYSTPMACLKSDQGESVLHLAASWGHVEVVKRIVVDCPCLLLEPNSKDQLPIHVAALAGHSAVVESLVEAIAAALAFASSGLAKEERDKPNLYLLKDVNGNTALHLALKYFYMEAATCLVNADQRASFLANNNGMSPLYLAVEAGDVSLVKQMLKITGEDGPEGRNPNLGLHLEGRKCLAHAALNSNTTDTLDVILEEYPSLVDELDGEGRTCLSFGASIGFIEGVCNLLDRSTKGVFVCDSDGSFPIHVAIKKGHVEVVKEILNRRPDSKQLRNKKGQNILHIAADSGKYKILCHLMTFEQSKHLANEQDVDGHTPLHLATIKWRPRAIIRLVGPKNLFILNNNGLTPLDIAESHLKPHYIYRERLTVMVLVYSHVNRDVRLMKTMKLTRPSLPPVCGGHKEYINALLLVAALIATVTFAAGFTIPGGFRSSAPNLGMANLATDGRLMCFLVFDTMALLSSVVAIFSLIWAQLGDPAVYQSSIQMAMPSLLSALGCMAYAFLYGLIIVAGNVKLLILIIYVIIIFYFYVMVKILVPHVTLQRPSLPAIWGRFLFLFMFLNDDQDESYQISTDRSVKSAESVEISGNNHVQMPNARH